MAKRAPPIKVSLKKDRNGVLRGFDHIAKRPIPVSLARVLRKEAGRRRKIGKSAKRQHREGGKFATKKIVATFERRKADDKERVACEALEAVLIEDYPWEDIDVDTVEEFLNKKFKGTFTHFRVSDVKEEGA